MPSEYLNRESEHNGEYVSHFLTERYIERLPKVSRKGWDLASMRWRLSYCADILKSGYLKGDAVPRMRGTIEHLQRLIDAKKANS